MTDAATVLGRAAGELSVGHEIHGPVRVVTAERIEWYDSGMLSAASGKLAQVGDNIHTDDDYAKAQGLPAVIADGMIMTNYCSEMLIGAFGLDYVARGELRTKFIKPVFLGETLFVKAKVLEVEHTAEDIVYTLDVWCENGDGVKVTDGHAKVPVRQAR